MITLYENPNYGNVLVKDERETFCPFQPPIPMPAENGGFTIMRLPCSTSCPHANIIGNTIEITCGSSKKIFDFVWQTDSDEESEEKVFQMKKI